MTKPTNSTWKADYALCAHDFLTSQPVDKPFIGEALRLHAKDYGLEEPHHPNVWGCNAHSVLREWLNAGLIKLCAGFMASTDHRAHGRKQPAYVRCAA